MKGEFDKLVAKKWTKEMIMRRFSALAFYSQKLWEYTDDELDDYAISVKDIRPKELQRLLPQWFIDLVEDNLTIDSTREEVIITIFGLTFMCRDLHLCRKEDLR